MIESVEARKEGYEADVDEGEQLFLSPYQYNTHDSLYQIYLIDFLIFS